MARRLCFLLLLLTPLTGPARELRIDSSARLRYDNDAQGQDLDSLFYTTINLSDLIKDQLNIKISGYGLWDIDNNDAFDEALDRHRVRISEGYADVRNIGPLSRARLGRQYLYDVDSLHFDGATLRFREKKPLSFFVFGGNAVSYYSSSDGDWLGGFGTVWKPNWRTRHQLDTYFQREEGENFLAYAWRWNQYWGRQWRTTSRLRFLNDKIRDYRLQVHKSFIPWNLSVSLDYFLQPGALGRGDFIVSRRYSHLSRILGARRPNHRIGLEISKFFGDKWLIQAGGSIRQRLEREEEENFNSLESKYGHFSITRFNNIIQNLDITLGFETVQNEMDRYFGASGEIAYRPTPKWQLAVGASLSRYSYDPIDFDLNRNNQADFDLILSDIRVPLYFFEARWKPSPKYDFRGNVSWETTNDIPGSGVSIEFGINYHLRHSLARENPKKPEEPEAESAETPATETSEPEAQP